MNGNFKRNGPQPIFPKMPTEAEMKREIRHEFGKRPEMRQMAFEAEESVEETAVNAPRFSREQLAEGIKMSIILSPPVSKQRRYAQIPKKR